MNIPSRPKALLIDANALIHRAWHALPPMTNSQGELVNAVYGFTSVLINILNQQRPDILVVCWDTAAPTFRHEARSDYKGHREKQPDEFYHQIPRAEQAVEVLGGTNISLDGYEADDLLGTLAVKLEQQGYQVMILTGDKDAWQLISDNISVIAFKKGVSETILYTPETLVQITGLRPDQIADYKAMRGDPSDNLPGIQGIGEKTATDLLVKFDNLKQIFKAAHNPESGLAPGVRDKLIKGEATAKEMLHLVTIKTDVPLPVSRQQLIRRPVEQSAVLKLFSELGFKSLINRLFGRSSANQNNDETGGTKAAKTKREPAVQKTTTLILNTPGELAEALKKVGSEAKLYLYIPPAVQTSFFEQPAALLLGTGRLTFSISDPALRDQGLSELKTLLENPKIAKTGHAVKNIFHWADGYGITIQGLSFDTEIASYLLTAGERSHELKTLSALYLQTIIREDKPEQELNAVRKLETVLQKKLKKENLWPIFETMEMPLIPILANMEKSGILIDVPYLKKLSRELTKEKQALEKTMHDLAGEIFNPLSPKQLSHILFDVLKISDKGIKRGKTGLSTAASELEKLDGTHPIIELIEQYRELSKLLSTYVDALPQQVDSLGRVHTTFNQVVTATGRLSSSDPNLQNIPIRTEIGRRVRRAFITKPGYALLACDYSQIELRIAAALAKDKNMLLAFENNEDIHTSTAAKIWDLKLDEVTKDQRRIAKAINFGLIFGQGPQGLARTAGIKFEEAKQFINKYFEVFSGIKEWMELSKALASERGYVETLFGRKRSLPEINSPLPQVRAQAERMAINMPIQGTEADLIKLAMIKVARELPKISKNANLLLQVHDELVFELPEKQVAKVTPQIVDIMQNIEKIGCPIIVDAKHGQNWEEMSPVK